LFGLQDAGRWSLVPARPRPQDDAAQARKAEGVAVEHVARILLRRYGVVCWRMLEREAAWLPPWRQLVRVLQRLEARGEIRGGRFIAGLSGEQFALPEAIALLRAVRKRPYAGELVCISASDPLNLAGTVLPGEKVPRIPGARVLLRDGVVVATLVAGEVNFQAPLHASAEDTARRMLRRLPGRSVASLPGIGGGDDHAERLDAAASVSTH
jgi:ATP-dependent Lhr-like helicase